MLKHVHLSPHRNRQQQQQQQQDTCSLRSSLDSTTSSSSTVAIRRPVSTPSPTGSSARQQRSSLAIDTMSISSRASSSSPEPQALSLSLSSRSSSYCSLSDVSLSTTCAPTTAIKVYCKCLRADMEYKTLRISYETTARAVIGQLLSKFRMRHRDPKLFYLTLEVTVRRAGLRTTLVLDDDARPAALQACQPAGDARLALQTARGGLVKIYDHLIMPGSQYKSLLISERTTVDELIQILLNCYNSNEAVEQFSVYEVCEDQEYQRKLHPDDCPLQVQHTWLPDLQFHFLIRRNSDYRRPKSSWTVNTKSSNKQNTVRVTSLLGKSENTTPRFSYYSDYDNYFYI